MKYTKKFKKGGKSPKEIMEEARRNQAIERAAIAQDTANTQAREAVQAARGSFGSYRSPQISVTMPTRTAQVAPVPQITPQTNLANQFKTRGEAFNYARKQGWKTFTYDDGKGKYKQFTTEVETPASKTTTQQTQQPKSTGQQKQATDTGGSLEKYRDHVYDENNLSGPRNINWNQFKVYPPGQESNRRQVMDDAVRQWAEGVNSTDYSELQNRVKQTIDDEWKQTGVYKTGKGIKGLAQYTSGTVGKLGLNLAPDILRFSGVWDVPETWISPTALDRINTDQTLKEYLPITAKDALVGASAIASQGILNQVLGKVIGAGATRAGSTKAIGSGARVGTKQAQKTATNKMLPKGKQQLQITTGQSTANKALPSGGAVVTKTHITPYTPSSGSGIWIPETQFFNQVPANRLLNLPPGAHQMQLPFHKQGGTIAKHQLGNPIWQQNIFDYLRNNVKPAKENQIHLGGQNYAYRYLTPRGREVTEITDPTSANSNTFIRQTVTPGKRFSTDGTVKNDTSRVWVNALTADDLGQWVRKKPITNRELNLFDNANKRLRQHQQGGAIEDLRITDEMMLEGLFRYFQAKGISQEDLINPETGSFNTEYEPDATKFLQTVGEDTAFWSMYKNAPDKAIAEYLATENPDMVEMAKKGAKLKKLQKYKKGNPIKKCSCGCDMITSREEGGKLVSKCACGCKN